MSDALHTGACGVRSAVDYVPDRREASAETPCGGAWSAPMDRLFEATLLLGTSCLSAAALSVLLNLSFGLSVLAYIAVQTTALVAARASAAVDRSRFPETVFLRWTTRGLYCEAEPSPVTWPLAGRWVDEETFETSDRGLLGFPPVDVGGARVGVVRWQGEAPAASRRTGAKKPADGVGGVS
jgi:hypothetical protein